MNKRKFGRVMFLTPFILLSTSILFRILYNNKDFFTSSLGNWVIPILEIVSTLGFYIAYLFLFTYPFLLAIGGFLMFKYRDKDKPVFSIKKIFSNIEKWFKKHNTFFSKKVSWKNVVLGTLVSLAVLLPILYFKVKRYYEAQEYYSSEEFLLAVQRIRIDNIKGYLKSLVPEKYEIVEYEFEIPSLENNGCVNLYQIYPKEFSELEKKYLSSAGIMFCEDINTAVLQGQVDEVRYNQTEGKWFYGDNVTALEEEQHGDNIVSTVSLGGSHALSKYYIVRLSGTNQLVVLSMPSTNRIRCEIYENGIESMDEDCLNFRDSLDPDYTDWVPTKLYEEYYNDLLEILEDINNNLSAKEKTPQEEYPDEFTEITENYDIDEYITNWNGRLDGYIEEVGYISSPEYFISMEDNRISKEWELKNGYILSLECPDRESIIPAFEYSCSLVYNNQLISDAVRHDIHTWVEKELMPSYIRFIVFSPEYNDSLEEDFELLVIGEYRGGLFDTISVYRLEDGKSILIPFYYNNEYRDTWLVENPIGVHLFYNREGNIKLITTYHEPSMSFVSVLREWNLEEDSLILERTLGNISE